MGGGATVIDTATCANDAAGAMKKSASTSVQRSSWKAFGKIRIVLFPPMMGAPVGGA
jgi:nitrate reductase NapE component